MTTLQDFMGLIAKRKIKTPSDNDYIISAAYTDTQERLKPQPKMEASLLSIAGIKKHILASIAPAKYKVFTALLTQNADDNQQNITGSDLTIGVTYRIADQAGGTWDFTNVGAPNNNVDTSFIATGTTPNSWGDNNEGQLTYNTGAPTAIVLENTIGNIWFAYGSAGIYSVNSNNLFIEDKTTIDIDNFGGNAVGLENAPFYIANETIINGESEFYIFTTRGLEYRNGVLQKNRLEIRVYN